MLHTLKTILESFGAGDKSGAVTPWGRSQQTYKLFPGVNWYSTAGHGGLGVAGSVAKQKLTPMARKLGEFSKNTYWYEEDVAWNIPFYENPDWDKAMVATAGGKSQTKEEMAETIKRYFPKYFDDKEHEKANAEEAHMKTKPELQIGDTIKLPAGWRPNSGVIEKIEGKRLLMTAGVGGKFRMPPKAMSAIISIERDGKIIWEAKKGTADA